MKIVIIDPSRIALKVLCAAATRRGDEVFAFATGGEGLSYLHALADIDLVITNIDPDDMDGCDVCRAVSAHRSSRSTPLILVTATRPNRTRIADIVISGADDVLELPFCESGFLARLRIIERLVTAEARLGQMSAQDPAPTTSDRLTVLRQLTSAIDNLSCDIPMSVAMFDIDHLDQINECFGRATGDSAVRAVDAVIGSAGGRLSGASRTKQSRPRPQRSLTQSQRWSITGSQHAPRGRLHERFG